MKDTWIGFLGVVLTIVIVSSMTHSGMGDIREQIGRVDERLKGIEDRMTKVEGRMTRIENRMMRLEERMTGIENRMTKVEEWANPAARGLKLPSVKQNLADTPSPKIKKQPHSGEGKKAGS